MALANPTLQIAAANKSGRSVMARLIKTPPALVPSPASFFGEVKPFEIKYSAQLIKSFQVLGLVVLKPALCQASPFSPPPRTCAIAITTSREASEFLSQLKTASYLLP